jgi:transcriptional regulator
MYLPRHFEEARPEVLHQAVRAHPLGLLVTQTDSGVNADSIPFMLDADAGAGGSAGPGVGILRGHVARANPLWHAARGEVLVVFQGPQAYISPSCYPTKAATGKVVPTWNYVMVQARGRLRAIEDAAALRALVTRLTERHEAPRAVRWAVSDAPADYIEAMLGAIVGIEITLTAIVGKWKVSQNRSAADRDGVARGLRDEAALRGDLGPAAMAALVARPDGP